MLQFQIIHCQLKMKSKRLLLILTLHFEENAITTLRFFKNPVFKSKGIQEEGAGYTSNFVTNEKQKQTNKKHPKGLGASCRSTLKHTSNFGIIIDYGITITEDSWKPIQNNHETHGHSTPVLPHFILLVRSRARVGSSSGCLDYLVFGNLLQLGQPQCVKDQVFYYNDILGYFPEGTDILLKGTSLLLPGQGIANLKM